MTNGYICSTSHRGRECQTQMLQKLNRLEHLEHLGAKQNKNLKCDVATAMFQDITGFHVSNHARHAALYPTVDTLQVKKGGKFQDVKIDQNTVQYRT